MYIEVTIGVFFGVSIASVIARVGFRIHADRSLYLEDYIVLLGAMCLSASTGIIYIFLIDALQRNPLLLQKASADQINDLLKTPFAPIYACLALSWTSIFAVKFSFLVFFRKLIDRVTKIHTLYWIVIIITLLSWLFMVVEPLTLCHNPSKALGWICPSPSQFSTC